MFGVVTATRGPVLGWCAPKSVLVVASVVLISGCSAAVVPQAAPEAGTVGPRASVDDRLVAAAQPLLPGYTYGGLTNTAEAVCDSLQGGTTWAQETQTLEDLSMTPANAASFMEIAIASYCHTARQLIPEPAPYLRPA